MCFILSMVVLSGLALGIYFMLPNNKVVPAFDEGGINMVIGGEVIDTKFAPKVMENEILVPFEIIKSHFDPNIYWDKNLTKVTITTKDKVIRMKTDKLDAVVNNKPVKLNFPVKSIDNIVYIPIEFLSELYKIEVKYLEDTNVVVIDKLDEEKKVAKPVKKSIAVRKGYSKRYPVIEKFENTSGAVENIEFRVFGEHENWYKVRTASGAVGYVQKRTVKVESIKTAIPKEDEESKDTVWKPENGKVNLVWEMMYSGRPNLSKVKKIDGLDVISPTWFEVSTVSGEIKNRADAKYVEWAHENNYKVWALFSNGFSDIKMTSSFLNNTDARDNAIRQILAYAALYKLDGINIDFENIYKSDKDALTQFVRELTPFLKEQGLVVSMDVTVPDGSDTYSLCYDRKALGEVVDYIMLMAYDQHWRTSPVAGSVAQITWVEENINKTLNYIPKEKLILGVPLYSRLWKEEKAKDGSVKVSSPKTISMRNIKGEVEANSGNPVWDQESGQFYAEYEKDGFKYRVWMEDETSIDLKTSLALKYDLAGVAAWSKISDSDEVWEVIKNNVKDTDSYEAWQNRNSDRKYVYK